MCNVYFFLERICLDISKRNTKCVLINNRSVFIQKVTSYSFNFLNLKYPSVSLFWCSFVPNSNQSNWLCQKSNDLWALIILCTLNLFWRIRTKTIFFITFFPLIIAHVDVLRKKEKTQALPLNNLTFPNIDYW